MENKEEIIENREKYKNIVDRVEKSKEILMKNLEIKKIIVPETSDRDELNSIMLVLKQIIRFLGNEESPNSNLINKQNSKISIIKSIEIAKDSKLQLSNDKLTVPLKFSESDFKEFIQNL